jgi:hypothetical protein
VAEGEGFELLDLLLNHPLSRHRSVTYRDTMPEMSILENGTRVGHGFKQSGLDGRLEGEELAMIR